MLCAQTTITILLGILGAILLRKSLLGRRGSDKEQAAVLHCASCGIAGGGEIRLNKCDNCDLVKYCSNECQRDHRSEHEVKCKERAAELRDELLFRQPESSHYGDCPICFLPLPLVPDKATLMSCCSKSICNGCRIADNIRQWEEKRQHPTCPFCRHPVPKTREEFFKTLMKRVAVNDPVALGQMALRHARREEYDAAFEYWIKAAELGDADAHYNLSNMYMKGEGVEKDEKKKIHHLEKAAIRGHPNARVNLGIYEVRNGRSERAVKHWIIAANLGHDESTNALKACYKDGIVSKEDFAAALRGHYAAVAARKSPQRELAEKSTQSDTKS